VSDVTMRGYEQRERVCVDAGRNGSPCFPFFALSSLTWGFLETYENHKGSQVISGLRLFSPCSHFFTRQGGERETLLYGVSRFMVINSYFYLLVQFFDCDLQSIIAVLYMYA
jgi:hypothetical protein